MDDDPIVDEGKVDMAILGKSTASSADATIVRQVSKTVDLFVDEVPPYPADLHIYPKNYTIKLSKENWHPLEELDPNTLS